MCRKKVRRDKLPDTLSHQLSVSLYLLHLLPLFASEKPCSAFHFYKHVKCSYSGFSQTFWPFLLPALLFATLTEPKFYLRQFSKRRHILLSSTFFYMTFYSFYTHLMYCTESRIFLRKLNCHQLVVIYTCILRSLLCPFCNYCNRSKIKQ